MNLECPNCGFDIQIDQVMEQQLESSVRKKYEQKYLAEKKELDEAKEKFAEQKEQENKLFKERLEKKLAEGRLELKKEVEEKLKSESKEQLDLLQQELNEKSEQVKELNKSKAEISRLQREKEELRDIIKLESEKELRDQLKLEKEKIQAQEKEKNDLVVLELKKQIEDQKKLTEEMQRKQEQGSMQLQGEVQEMAIEEWLETAFPLDTIEEIKKGSRGGDCIQTVNTREFLNCGKIYYESKRTKTFQNDWIPKFKNDLREKGISVGVLITQALPKGIEKVGMVDGIWVCGFGDYQSIVKVLRDAIIRVHQAHAAQSNKGDKMSLLYDYLTGPNFKMQLNSIVQAFEKLKMDLEKEKRAMQKIWKEREIQIDQVVNNTIDMYGSLRGIAGNNIQTISSLELDAPDEDE